jgi:hypothetical protein
VVHAVESAYTATTTGGASAAVTVTLKLVSTNKPPGSVARTVSIAWPLRPGA